MVEVDHKRIRIRTSSYFPKTVRAIGAVFCIFGLAMVWTSPVLGLLFIFITAVIFNTHYGFEINLNPNSFREYVSVLGWRDGSKTAFKSIEFLFIQQGKIAFLTYTLREKELPSFEGYLKFEGRNEVQALTDIDKNRLIGKMKNLASNLNVEVKDFSDGKPETIFKPSQKNSN